ncbi:hypothetical protein P12x_001034 [Tundrisphaera lichenicola]|uniref:hypothetical protein n=1 Tax=Tundrisphaera lichenicola TaxID=2029860 RepID=UPI003EBCD3EE
MLSQLNHAKRPSLRLRADVPELQISWVGRLVRPTILTLAAFFVLVGGSNLDLGPAESRLALALSEPIGPFGRAFGYWDPSTWPASIGLGQIWSFFEEEGPTQGAVRWPSAIAAVLIGVLTARRVRLAMGSRAGLLVALAWFGSVAAIDRSGGSSGLDLITGLGTVAALDRLLGRGSGWVVGFWASFAFLAGGWTPLAVLGLSTIVLGRSGTTWKWSMTIPIAATVAGWSAWALSAAPAEAWASALGLPITQSSAWTLPLTVIGLGLPWAPFAFLARSRKMREGWGESGRPLVMGWLQVAGASILVGTIVPGLASAALAPSLVGLAVVSAACWDRLCVSWPELPRGVRRGAIGLTLAAATLWFALVLSWGGYVGFAVAYYRSTIIGVALLSLAGFLLALHAFRKREVLWALGGLILVSIAIKIAHWGYYVPEWNYRASAGPWGRAIAQWVPVKHPIYVLHSWPAELAFAMARPVRQLASPQHIDFQPGEGSKFVLLQDAEYAEYQNWSDGWPKLLKVAEFEDEMGLGRRILTRTDAPLIIRRPYRTHDPRE